MSNRRALTPPEWMEIHRYRSKVSTILDHVRVSTGCRCGVAADEKGWAQHLADQLFPHRGVGDLVEDWHGMAGASER